MHGVVLFSLFEGQLGPTIGKQIGCGVVVASGLNRGQAAGRFKVWGSGFDGAVVEGVLAQDGEGLADEFLDHEQLAFRRAVQIVVVDRKTVSLDHGPGPLIRRRL